jgi:hypothetical protein
MTNPDADPDDNRPSLLPILTALALIGFALIAIVVLRMFRGDAQPDEGLIGTAAVGQNDALQRGDYADFQTFTCVAEQGTEARVLADQQQSETVHGARIVDDVTGIAVNGDRATATVVYHFERSPDDKIKTATTFVRENEEWKVCSPGPR